MHFELLTSPMKAKGRGKLRGCMLIDGLQEADGLARRAARSAHDIVHANIPSRRPASRHVVTRHAQQSVPLLRRTSRDTQRLPLGERMTPGKGTPSFSSRTTPWCTSRVPVHLPVHIHINVVAQGAFLLTHTLLQHRSLRRMPCPCARTPCNTRVLASNWRHAAACVVMYQRLAFCDRTAQDPTSPTGRSHGHWWRRGAPLHFHYPRRLLLVAFAHNCQLPSLVHNWGQGHREPHACPFGGAFWSRMWPSSRSQVYRLYMQVRHVISVTQVPSLPFVIV